MLLGKSASFGRQLLKDLNSGLTSSKTKPILTAWYFFVHPLTFESLSCRLVINQYNHTVVESMLSWRKFRHLKTLKIRRFSERVARAVRRHQKIQRLHFSELTHHSFNHKRVPSLVDCILDPDREKPLLSQVKELRLTNCYLPCHQLWKILSAIFEGRSSVEKLELGDIASDECSNYHDICPVPARMLGQAASKLRILSIQEMPFNASQLETFFKAFSNPESLLEELTISDAPNMVDLDPSTLAKVLAIPTLKKITLNAVNLGLLQTQLFLEKIRQGGTNLKELSINFDSFNNRDNNNRVRKVEAFLLAGAINQLERVKLGNVNLSGTQVRWQEKFGGSVFDS